MENLSNYITEILVLLFILITFLQSGIDKLTDWSGNIAWLKGHFSKTFLSDQVPLMLAIILALEILVGITAVLGIVQMLLYARVIWGFYCCILAAVTLLMLLFGQRVAKDYPGAFTITGYFIVVIFGVFIMSHS